MCAKGGMTICRKTKGPRALFASARMMAELVPLEIRIIRANVGRKRHANSSPEIGSAKNAHHWPKLTIMAGQEGFEPPTFGFGDRRSAIGTTGLK